MSTSTTPAVDPLLAASVLIYEVITAAIAAYGVAPVKLLDVTVEGWAEDALYAEALINARGAFTEHLRRNPHAYARWVAATEQTGNLAKILAQAALDQYEAVLAPEGEFPPPA